MAFIVTSGPPTDRNSIAACLCLWRRETHVHRDTDVRARTRKEYVPR